MSVKCLIYCSKAKPNLYKTNFVKIEDIKRGIWDKLFYEIDNNERLYLNGEKKEKLNGKIVASFDCEKVEEIFNEKLSNGVGYDNFFYTEELDSLFSQTQLDEYEMVNYLGSKGNGEKVGYAIHISNLEIFDKPKELNEYMVKAKKDKNWTGHKYTVLHKAPQNMCTCYNRYTENQYVLISVRPEWVAKILNGEKTIEVRKQVVNKLKELI